MIVIEAKVPGTVFVQSESNHGTWYRVTGAGTGMAACEHPFTLGLSVPSGSCKHARLVNTLYPYIAPPAHDDEARMARLQAAHDARPRGLFGGRI